MSKGDTSNATKSSLAVRNLKATERRQEQVERVCNGCGEFGYNPCKSSGTGHAVWCQGMHIIGMGGKAFYCYKCSNDAYSRGFK